MDTRTTFVCERYANGEYNEMDIGNNILIIEVENSSFDNLKFVDESTVLSGDPNRNIIIPKDK
jgi:hypothetical protein